jgi:hypothetical protein
VGDRQTFDVAPELVLHRTPPLVRDAGVFVIAGPVAEEAHTMPPGPVHGVDDLGYREFIRRHG